MSPPSISIDCLWMVEVTSPILESRHCAREANELMPNEIDAYYKQSGEKDRLSNPWGQLERLRTDAILASHLPAAPAVVCDVGGAAGAYAIPLAKKGYAVHLVDPVELHLAQVRSKAQSESAPLASITQGDARRLDFQTATADAALLLGPLYHLAQRHDRLQALREARRVLRPQGVLFAAAISRFASLIDALSRGFFKDPEFRKIVEADLQHGLHLNPTGNLDYFTTAYFHRPEELAAEIVEAGFVDVQVRAIEGPAWSATTFPEVWSDEAQRGRLLEFLSAIESEPCIIGASAHFLATAHRPD